MCIVCHYKHDNQLVTPEARRREHPDGLYKCLRPLGALKYTCIDCRTTTDDHNHVCDDLPVANPAKARRKNKVYKDLEEQGRRVKESMKGPIYDKIRQSWS